MVAPAQGRPARIGVHPPRQPKICWGYPPRRNAFPGRSLNFSRDTPLWGRCAGVGGVQVGRIPARGLPAIISTHHPRGPKCAKGSPLRVVAYGVWCPFLQAPVRGRPAIVEGLPPPLPQRQIPPSPRGRNSCSFLLMIPISPTLCARTRGDGTGSAAASTPPLSYPPELSVQFVEIRSFCSSS